MISRSILYENNGRGKRISPAPLLLFLAFLPSLLLHARQGFQSAGLTNQVYRSWNNQNGLPQNTVYDIVQDDKGYLWGATEEGLFRFDGAEFYVIHAGNTPGISSSIFYDILSADGYIWASGRDFLLRIGNKVEKIINLPDAAYGGWIKCLAMDVQNRLWIGTSNGGLFYLQNDSVYACSGWKAGGRLSIEAMVIAGGQMVIGTSKGLFKMAGPDSPASSVSFCGEAHILSLAADKRGQLWAGTSGQGLFRLGLRDSTLIAATAGLRENAVFSLHLSGGQEDSIWIGFRNRGVQLLYQDKLHTPVASPYGHEGVRAICSTQDGLTWLGTNSSGLVQMKSGTIRTTPPAMGLAEKVILPIYQHTNGDTWVGTAGRGIYRIAAGITTLIDQAAGLSADLVLSVQGAGHHIYIGTSNGLDRYNMITGKIDKHYTVKDGLQSNWIISTHAAADGRVWVTTRVGGLHYIGTDGNLSTLALPASAGSPNLISIFEDKNRDVWFGTRGAGLIKVGMEGSIIHYDASRFPADVVYSFYEDREGDKWMGTDKGLVVSYGNGFRVLNKSAGLFFSEAYRILRDPSGYLWLSGNLGLQKIAEDDLLKAKKNTDSTAIRLPVRLFNAFDGMPNAETNGGFYPAGWAMNDGTLWFPTVNGVAVADYRMTGTATTPLGIIIQSLRYGDMEYFSGEKISIAPGVMNFEVRYTSIDFSKADDIHYFYRLKGYNNEWIAAGNRHVAYFSSLPHGHYTFEVKAERYGEWSPVATLSFHIRPHFYQAWWFKILIAALVLAAALAVYYLLRKRVARKLREQQRINLAQINGQEKERQFISHELHDSINQQLSTAKIYLNYLRTNPGKREELLAKSEEVVQKAINEIRQLCNALTPPGLQDIGLQEALEDLVTSYTVVGNLKIDLKMDDRLSEIDEGLQFILYRITQEALNNVVRHSKADSVRLHFASAGNQLHITVQDNGKGFDTRVQKPGVGFENIHNRLSLYNGKMEIKSAPGMGCTLQMTLSKAKNPGL